MRRNITDGMVCRAVAKFTQRNRRHIAKYGLFNFQKKLNFHFPYEVLSRATGESEKVRFRAMERAAAHGLIEYGVSLRTAWLTNKGEKLIEVPE